MNTAPFVTRMPELAKRPPVECRDAFGIEEGERGRCAAARINTHYLGGMGGILPACHQYPACGFRAFKDAAAFAVERFHVAAFCRRREQPHPTLVVGRDVQCPAIGANRHVVHRAIEGRGDDQWLGVKTR